MADTSWGAEVPASAVEAPEQDPSIFIAPALGHALHGRSEAMRISDQGFWMGSPTSEPTLAPVEYFYYYSKIHHLKVHNTTAFGICIMCGHDHYLIPEYFYTHKNPPLSSHSPRLLKT